MGIVNPSSGGGGSWFPTTTPVVGTATGSGTIVQPPAGVVWVVPIRVWSSQWLLKSASTSATWALTDKTALSTGPHVLVTANYYLVTLGAGTYNYNGWLAI